LQQAPFIMPDRYKFVGKSIPRLDLPAKLTGKPIFVHDMRLDGMLHARVIRPPNYAAELASVDAGKTEAAPGIKRVIQKGSFLAVVAESEFQSVLAMRALQVSAVWKTPDAFKLYTGAAALLRNQPSEDKVLEARGEPVLGNPKAIAASYSRPYVMHGSIGPSFALAHFSGGRLQVWTHSQGVFALRSSIAKLLSLPEDRVDCIHAEGAGCYGHNGADDVAADAAIIAVAMPDKPIRVQWMREDEHGWEPYGSPMTTDLRATLSNDGNISGWDCELWSLTFTTRPGWRPENLLEACLWLGTLGHRPVGLTNRLVALLSLRSGRSRNICERTVRSSGIRVMSVIRKSDHADRRSRNG
jgi:CO/xanthine dehydrogenase Mo-binding subunit